MLNKNYEVRKGFYSEDYNKFLLCVCKNKIAIFDVEPTQEQIENTVNEWKESAFTDTIEVKESLGAEPININISDIRKFGISNQKTWTNKGSFKTWWKRYYIRTTDGKMFWIYESDFNILKERLDGKYNKEKYTQSEYKGYSEKKATDWTYTLIQG
jgi:hypothetical protein